MTNIFLTSSVNNVAHHIPKYLKKSPKEMKLLFIDTAAEVEKGDISWLIEDRNSLIKAGFNVTDYSIVGKNSEQIHKKIGGFDIIYFSGGNQFYLLEKIQESGCVEIIRNFVIGGKIYIGCSAGSIVAGPDISITRLLDEAKFSHKLQSSKGFGLVDFIILPHWGSDDFKEIYSRQRLETAYKTGYKIILLTDYQYVRVKDDWYQIVEVD